MEQTPNKEELSRKERRELERQQRKENPGQIEKDAKRKKILSRTLIISIIALFVAGVTWVIATAPSGPNLPPTTGMGHIEKNPIAHITDKPIPDPIQRHMLEHADGGGKPGIIIQYNCEKYTCAPDLIDKLTALVKQYPDNVYLAPNTYAGEIILTKEGDRLILDAFDEGKIKAFIVATSSPQSATSTPK